jgi:hypothetical protein
MADLAFGMFAASVGLKGKSDVATLPLLVLAAGAVSLALMPAVSNALSRAYGRQTDRWCKTLHL